MNKNKIDLLRLTASLMVIFGIIYFYANLFAPRLVPRLLRIGVIRRPTNILVLGTDLNYEAETGKRLTDEGRTDTILLLRVDPARYQLKLLSIPRDSFVEIPGYGPQKINAANVYGGAELAKKTVAKIIGKNVDYYLKVNPQILVRLIDLLGGVNIFVDEDMYYNDNAAKLKINLKKGWHKLSGKEAEGYLRFRHDFAGDIGRIERQQKFLEVIFRSFATPSNLLKAPLALEVAAEHIQTDLPLSKIIRLANFARMLSPNDVRTFTASGEPGTSEYAGSIWLLNRADLEKVVKDYF